ncbi:MAG: hypothetical protein JWO15_3532 [Sphingomonadales bacterium]|nr:hypothetical protein [Sphingomonadales bacterium]
MIPSSFKQVIGEMIELFEHFNNEADSYGSTEIAYYSLKSQYELKSRRASIIASEFSHNSTVMADAKLYVEKELTPSLLHAPMVHRSYHKPLGYPGDYQIMLYYYDNQFMGNTRAAQIIHKLFVNHPLSRGVVTRKEYVWKRLLGYAPKKVTSLGCGPALEMADSIEHLPRTYWQMIDQEPLALEYAHAQTNHNNKVTLVNRPFKDILKQPNIIEGNQDFIYVTGLFDYLKLATGQHLVAGLLDALAPGGMLLVANAAAPNDHFFDPEFVLDWPLIYRTSKDMMDLVPAGVRSVQLDLEDSGAYYFLTIEK